MDPTLTAPFWIVNLPVNELVPDSVQVPAPPLLTDRAPLAPIVPFWMVPAKLALLPSLPLMVKARPLMTPLRVSVLPPMTSIVPLPAREIVWVVLTLGPEY